MIKHQEELVNVTNLDSSLHRAEIDDGEISEKLNKDDQAQISEIPQPPNDCFDDNLIKNEAICLCEEADADKLTRIDEDEQLYNVKI